MNSLTIPGFVDLQVNGHLGIDFSSPDLTEETFAYACRKLIQAGTYAFLPTVITSPLDTFERNLPIIAAVMAREEFHERLLGIHLEGPFISPEPGAVGAHQPEWVRNPDVETFKLVNQWSRHTIRILTLAAERPGAEDLTRYATAQGIIISIGHTLATPADLDRMTQAGAKAFTHLGNGLPHLLHKFNNPLWAGLSDDRYTAMMIGDGHHIPDNVLKTMIRAKGISRSIIVSDASPIAGMPPGRYRTLGNEVVLEENGLLYNPEKGFLVGSSSTLLGCINHISSLGIFTPEELIDLGFHNPLHLLKLPVPSDLPSTGLQFDPITRKFSVSNV